MMHGIEGRCIMKVFEYMFLLSFQKIVKQIYAVVQNWCSAKLALFFLSLSGNRQKLPKTT